MTKEMNPVIVIALILVAFLLGLSSGNPVVTTKETKCEVSMQKAIPDANDTVGRSNYLQNCEK